MTRLANYNAAAWETEHLFAECRDSLVRYLRYRLDDFSEAEDIAQESFLRFFQARSRKERILQPRAWLFRVAHNLSIDQGRKKRPELLNEKEWVSIEGKLISPSSRSIENAVYVSQLAWERLTAAELECLRLRSEGLKFREIAEVLDLSVSTVVSYIARAISKLRASEVGKSETPKHGRAPAAV